MIFNDLFEHADKRRIVLNALEKIDENTSSVVSSIFEQKKQEPPQLKKKR